MRRKKVHISLITVFLLLLPILYIPVGAMAMESTDDTRAVVPPIERGHITFNVYLYWNSNMNSTTSSSLSSKITAASNAFNSKFNVSFNQVFISSSAMLNQRSGCHYSRQLYCDEDCGALSSCTTLHHKSGAYFIRQLASTNRKVFRYVDYAICWYERGNHGHAYGLTADRYNIIVTSLSTNVQKIICHELSHWIGAEDYVCTSTNCVLSSGSTTNNWCSRCQQDINAYLDEYWEGLS